MRLVSVVPLVLSLFSLSACSVVMAAHGEGDPDYSVLHAGTPRASVEKVLTNTLAEGGTGAYREVTYQFFTNDEPSYGRAAAYGLLDVATLGIAELATTPVEALQGDKHLVTVTYDPSGRVYSVHHRIEKATLPKPERALGIEHPATADAGTLTPASNRQPPTATLPTARAREL